MRIVGIGVQPVISQASPYASQQAYRVVALIDGEPQDASNTIACTNDLSLAGNMNVVHWQDDNSETPTAFRIYKAANGGFGLIGETAGATKRFIDDNIVPDMGQAPPAT